MLGDVQAAFLRAAQGFFDLAQAKNAMGANAISAHSYDTRMTAIAIVSSTYGQERSHSGSPQCLAH